MQSKADSNEDGDLETIIGKAARELLPELSRRPFKFIMILIMTIKF